MSRRTETLDPQVARELEELEAALTGAPGADPELTALVRDVRADAPPMAPAFAARLDERVREGFPRARRFPALVPRRALLPAMGFAATVLLALVVIGGNGSDDEQQPASLSAPVAAEQDASAGSSAKSAAPPQALSAPQGSADSARRVERNAQLTLTTSPKDVQDVADDVIAVTQAAGGFVAASQVQSGDAGGGASFDLRIPTAKLDDTLERLSDLAHVGSLNQGSADITAPFNAAADRLSDLRAERRGLLRALGRATTDREIDALRARLRANRSAMSQAKGELAALRKRATMATVAVTVQGTGREEVGGGAWTPRDALGDAVRVLEVTAGVALVAAAVALPLALLLGIGAAGGRSVRRRRRAHVLDGA